MNFYTLLFCCFLIPEIDLCPDRLYVPDTNPVSHVDFLELMRERDRQRVPTPDPDWETDFTYLLYP